MRKIILFAYNNHRISCVNNVVVFRVSLSTLSIPQTMVL